MIESRNTRRARRATLSGGIFALVVWHVLFAHFMSVGAEGASLIIAAIGPLGLLAGSWLVALATLPDIREDD